MNPVLKDFPQTYMNSIIKCHLGSLQTNKNSNRGHLLKYCKLSPIMLYIYACCASLFILGVFGWGGRNPLSFTFFSSFCIEYLLVKVKFRWSVISFNVPCFWLPSPLSPVICHTLDCYFCLTGEVHSMFCKAGLDEKQNLIDRRLQVNRKKQVKMHRVWVQGKFQKPL